VIWELFRVAIDAYFVFLLFMTSVTFILACYVCCILYFWVDAECYIFFLSLVFTHGICRLELVIKQSMAEEMAMVESGRAKRKFVKTQGRKKSSKKAKVMPSPHGQKKVKIDKKMKKLFRKRAREYNSDDEEDEATVTAPSETRVLASVTNKKIEEDDIESENNQSEDEGAAGPLKKSNKNATDTNNLSSDDEGEDDNEIQPGITKFTEGCRAFKMAFRNIMKKSVPDDMLVSYLNTEDYDFTEHMETSFFKTWIICRVQYCQPTRNLL